MDTTLGTVVREREALVIRSWSASPTESRRWAPRCCWRVLATGLLREWWKMPSLDGLMVVLGWSRLGERPRTKKTENNKSKGRLGRLSKMALQGGRQKGQPRGRWWRALRMCMFKMDPNTEGAKVQTGRGHLGSCETPQGISAVGGKERTNKLRAQSPVLAEPGP